MTKPKEKKIITLSPDGKEGPFSKRESELIDEIEELRSLVKAYKEGWEEALRIAREKLS